MANISATLEKDIVDEIDRIAKHNGKTRTRIIMEACIEYIHYHEIPNIQIFESEHYDVLEVDWNRFHRMRKQVMDMENAGVIGLSGSGENLKVHFEDGTILGAEDEIRP